MERSADHIWRAYEDRTLSELLQFDSESDTDDIREYIDPFDREQESEATNPDPDEVNIYSHN